MSQINCLKCRETIESENEACPQCGEKITTFQRTYSTRLLDGKYQIIDRLGVGGMGEIFKVRHIHLNELRVIKIMRPNVAADDQGLQRFLQEARTSTMIKHKNLAMLYDFAQLDDGSYYMVWEFIDGTNIQKWIAQNGPMPPRLTVEISVQALTGLEHLHSMGLIHRDISPENIMLSQDHHGKLAVKVIDFGIAKQLAEGEGGQGLTQTGMFLGKLKYASPEQAGFLKEGEHIDPRSDLYSFGIVMYEMLSGRAPFHATNPHGYILKHVTEPPPPISEINPDVRVPSSLETIIMRSLEKSRDVRFANAGEFVHALEAIRAAIAPDQKYGLGERMITLSGAKTLAELPKITGTAPQMTASGAQATELTMKAPPPAVRPPGRGPTGTVVGSDEATVLERNLTAGGSDEATVLERFDHGTAAPTVLEEKARPGAAAPGPGSRGAPAAPKKKFAVVAAAAAVVLAIVVAVVFLNRKPEPAPVAATVTTPAAGTEVTSTPSVSPAPLGADEGLLLLSASPWGDLDRIVSKTDQREITLGDDDRSTPARIALSPGEYTVTMSGPGGKKTVDVQIQAGRPTERNVAMGSVDFDALAEEVSRQ